MMQSAIQVENLSKRYEIGAEGGMGRNYRTFREVIMDTVKTRVQRSARGQGGNGGDTIWALKDVSFDIKPGEVVGIIGRNGSGKSTLLKILSRITEPTSGRVRLNGRVGSLLEVGTGFHGELTGRENIYLNGSILGMRRWEIDRQFDAIVDFAQVERLLDTPVKRYSSGMYMRLAFAVAAHLNPEILLVDEVLAVGDVDFQQKCIGSMQSVANSGRTVLLVSHNLALIESLCRKAVWLDKGTMETSGRTSEVVAAYVRKSRSWATTNLLEGRRKPGSTARFASVQILDEGRNECQEIAMGSGMTVKLRIEADEPIRAPWIGVTIMTPLNQRLFHCASREAGYELEPVSGHCTVSCHFPTLNLLPGRYYLDLSLADMTNTRYDMVPSAAYFDVRNTDVFATGMPMGQEYGMMFLKSQWELSKQEPEMRSAAYRSGRLVTSGTCPEEALSS